MYQNRQNFHRSALQQRKRIPKQRNFRQSHPILPSMLKNQQKLLRCLLQSRHMLQLHESIRTIAKILPIMSRT